MKKGIKLDVVAGKVVAMWDDYDEPIGECFIGHGDNVTNAIMDLILQKPEFGREGVNTGIEDICFTHSPEILVLEISAIDKEKWLVFAKNILQLQKEVDDANTFKQAQTFKPICIVSKRRAIIDFLFWKRGELCKIAVEGALLFDKEDLDEIETWSDESVEKVYYGLKSILDMGRITDFKICPWCVLADAAKGDFDGCENCQYGKRHGICAVGGGSNIYARIHKAIGHKAFFDVLKTNVCDYIRDNFNL